MDGWMGLRQSGNPRQDKLTKRKFSTFLKSVVVELNGSQKTTPGLPNGNLIEVCLLFSPSLDKQISHLFPVLFQKWYKPPSHPHQDGFTIQRALPPTHNPAEGVPCRILLQLEYDPPRFKVLPQLAKIIDIKEDTKANVTQAVWNYIKIKGLQDKDDRRKVRGEGAFGKVCSPRVSQPLLRT